ncbi:glycosyltransferase [Nocardioides montaniterrae]
MFVTLLSIALVVVSLGLTVVASTTLWWMLHAWWGADVLEATGFPSRRRLTDRSFSLLVPARHEEAVLGHTLDRLAELDHPAFEVLAIVGDDDPGTEAVARAAADRHPGIVRVVVDGHVPKSKPKAMNTALPLCRGDVVGVFDAEDDVHPALLRRIDGAFAESGADVVQGGVQLMNLQSSWWALRNCLEYYFWFRSRLHFHAAQRFIPLGGNTVFVRTELLRAAGGWDGECLAEDCELGVRLSTDGAAVAVSYDPALVTREETPSSVPALVKQRTRWNQGFLQVYRKGEWRRLPSWRQRALARYTLAMPFLQAMTGLLVPVSLVLMLTVHVPLPVAMVALLPIVPTVVTFAVETAAVGDFARCYGLPVRLRDYVRVVLGAVPYQLLLAFAAMRAVVREVVGSRGWEKTEHAGLHLDAARTPAPVVEEAA